MWKMKIMTQSVTSKAAELRAKTDRQLMQLIERNLDRALKTDESAAEVAYRSAQQLLAVAYGATNTERHRVEAKLAELVEHQHVLASCA